MYQNVFSLNSILIKIINNDFISISNIIEIIILLLIFIISFIITKEIKTRYIKRINTELLSFNLLFFILSCILCLLTFSIIAKLIPSYSLNIILLTFNILFYLSIITLLANLIQYTFLKNIKKSFSIKLLTYIISIFLIILLISINNDSTFIEWIKTHTTIVIGKKKIPAYKIIMWLIWIVFIIYACIWIGDIIETLIMHISPFDSNIKIILSNTIKYSLIFLAFLLILPIIGIDITTLAVFGGAFGAGLGFGLRNIASNYISGFMILIDRTIKLNDRVTIDDFTGYITKIAPRFTVIKDSLGKEAIVPNESIVSKIIINESYSSKLLQRIIPLQVAYETDIEKAIQIILDSTNNKTGISNDRPPSVNIVGFKNNGIALELKFWIVNPELGLTRYDSDIYLTIWSEFKKVGIKLSTINEQNITIHKDNFNLLKKIK